jgi:hypothetical protein
MTILSELEQIFITRSEDGGTEIQLKLAQAEQLTVDLYELLSDVAAIHPQSDAANHAAILAIISSIAQPTKETP